MLQHSGVLRNTSTEFGIVGKPCASYVLQSCPGKMSSAPKEVALLCSNHLKEALNRAKTLVYRRCYEFSPNKMFIISSATLIRMTARYCHGIYFGGRKTLTRSNQTMQSDFWGGKTSSSAPCPQLSQATVQNACASLQRLYAD